MPRHFFICVLPSKLPKDAPPFGVALSLPCINFSFENCARWQSSIQALAVKNANLDFCHIEPTGMFWCVMEYDPAQERIRRLFPKYLIETLAKVRVEIIHDKMDATRLGIDIFNQVLNEENKVKLATMFGDRDSSVSAFWLYRHEEVTSSGARVFIIVLGRCAWFHRQDLTSFPDQLFALLVYADDRLLRSKWLGIEFQKVIHSFSILFCQDTNTPHQL